MAQLRIYQSLWGMERLRPDGAGDSLETQLGMIRDAGFDGVSVSYEDAGLVGQVAPFLAAHQGHAVLPWRPKPTLASAGACNVR